MTEWSTTDRDESAGKQVRPELVPFATWLVREMDLRRIKNNELALKLKVSTGAISEYRRALRRPRDAAQQKLAQVFGKDPDVVYRLLDAPTAAGTVDAALSAGTVTPQAVIASIRAHLDSLELQIASGHLTDDEARRMLERGNQGTDG